MKSTELMTNIATDIQNMLHNYGRRDDIVITYRRMDDKTLEEFSTWTRSYHHIYSGEEYFFVWEPFQDGLELLYAVNVTGDSLLTAAQELMDLVALKF